MYTFISEAAGVVGFSEKSEPCYVLSKASNTCLGRK